MAAPSVKPSGVERHFGEDEIIVSKTDLKGIITYANRVFLKIAGYHEQEILGQPHNVIRHPDMPRCVFKLLWDTLNQKSEIFAYVMNMAKNGDHYWVFAHVTPTFDDAGTVTGYHSSRRTPDRRAMGKVTGLYTALLAEERRHNDWRAGMQAGIDMLSSVLRQQKLPYDEFVFTL